MIEVPKIIWVYSALPEQMPSEVRWALYSKQSNENLQVRIHLNFGDLFWIRARPRHLFHPENDQRTRVLLPAQPYTVAHFPSRYLCGHLQSQPWLSSFRFRLCTRRWKLMKHDSAKRKSAPPLIATWVHQNCHARWHARHNKHLWSQTPSFVLPQNKGCWWQMGRVERVTRPKS